MNVSTFKKKLWLNIFIRIAVIFVVFVLVLCISNVGFLVKFFSEKEKNALKEQITVISELNFDDSSSVIKKMGEINEEYNFDVEIYTSDGSIVYTTHGGQMLDYFHLPNNNKFDMSHEKTRTIESERLSGGIVFERAIRDFDKTEFLLCRKEIRNNLFAEIRVQERLISNSAAIANEFIVIISAFCFAISIIWVFIFARQFSKPITQMSRITHDMSNLNFERRLDIKRYDEIGELAESINHMSDSLSTALEDLKATNQKLLNDIEAERQLDVMRRGFVANVSHELKTPISIISGYAEGLKLNINEESKEMYCNTIIDESHRMNKLVLSILELSRYESGQIPLNKQIFDVSVMSAEMGKRILTGKNITFENCIPDKTLVFADEMQIEQVVKSLLENAVSHTKESGKIRISLEENGDIYKISVFNSGEHIPPEIMPQIWQSFYRGDKSHKRESVRFGLGLSIVSAIIKMHGRNCGVKNAENGVEFWFELEKVREEI